MPRDIVVLVESKIEDFWTLALPMVKNTSYDYQNLNENKLNDTMYINEYYPKAIYDDYDPAFWKNFGVEGRFSTNTRDLPNDCNWEVSECHKSYGDECFQEHWISCAEFLRNVEASTSDEHPLVSKLKELSDSKSMRLMVWFSQ